MREKTYDSKDEIVIGSWHWVRKNACMCVCIEGHDLIVERSVAKFYETMLSTCVYIAAAPARFSNKDDEGKVLMLSDGLPYEGWDSEEAFVEAAKCAWYANHMSEKAKREARERSDAIKRRVREKLAAEGVGNGCC